MEASLIVRSDIILEGKIDKGGVLSTSYGQTANMMTGGCLAELDKSPVSFNSIGSLGC